MASPHSLLPVLTGGKRKKIWMWEKECRIPTSSPPQSYTPDQSCPYAEDTQLGSQTHDVIPLNSQPFVEWRAPRDISYLQIVLFHWLSHYLHLEFLQFDVHFFRISPHTFQNYAPANTIFCEILIFLQKKNGSLVKYIWKMLYSLSPFWSFINAY